MNNKSTIIIAALCLGASISAVSVRGQDVAAENSFNPAMSLSIVVEKDSYLPWEPITVRTRFENETKGPLPTLVPYVINDASILIEAGSEKREFGELTVLRSLMVRQHVVAGPGQGFDQEFVLERALDELMPKPGIYVLRLVLNSGGGKRIISNPVAIKIDAATGIDAEALEFIAKNKTHSSYPVLFSWKAEAKTETGKTLLEEFVSRFERSAYGDYAILQLGNYYFARREFERAKAELNKVRNSPILKVATDARGRLADVEKAESFR